MAEIAYITDVEGRWDKIASFAKDNPLVSIDDEGRIRVREGAVLVFGGDAIDRGPDGLRVVRALVEAKRSQPDRVVLLAGNRDINKLRLSRELRGRPPARAPERERSAGGAVLLRWILENTMGAKEAFEHRRSELERLSGGSVSDADVCESLRSDVARDGVLRAFLLHSTLAYRAGDALFVHGAVTDENFGVVPTGETDADERVARCALGEQHVDAWVAALDRFYRQQIEAFDRGAESVAVDHPAPWAALVAYQAPLPGTRTNQQSVVYGRPADALGNPSLPSRELIAKLARDGVRRVFVGHTPSGDSPSVLRFEGFSLVLADNSYARVEGGSQVSVLGDRTLARGTTALDDGTIVATTADWTASSEGPLGARAIASGLLVKGTTERATVVGFRALEGYRITQRELSEGELGATEAPFA
ncbi:MAG: metallophosphoesterase [Myxococcales bacterium]|nr:metallophosphoesterase [Myxococcales bacterium]